VQEQTSVGVVISNEWYRRGMATAIAECAHHRVAAVADHRDAMACTGALAGLDLVVVDAFSRPDDWDRLGGANVVARLKAALDPPKVVALLPSDPYGIAELRMLEVGADRLIDRAAVTDAADLRHLVLGGRSTGSSPRELADRLRPLGLTTRSRPGAGLELVREHGLADEFDAPEPSLSRRQTITIRTRLSEAMGMAPIPAGSGAVITRVLPSWRQVCDVIQAARGLTCG